MLDILNVLSMFADNLEEKLTNIFAKKTDAAPKTHQHGNSDITGLDAVKLTGTIDLARLPVGALERCVVVANDAARFTLAKTNVQIGDTVKVTATGLMYFVVDDTKLNTEAGYEVYTAGSATSVPWAGVTNKPVTFPPATHNHSVSQIDNFPTSMKNPTALTIQVNGVAVGTYDGSVAKTVNVTPESLGITEITEADIDAMMAGKFK